MQQLTPETAARYREVIRLRAAGLSFDDIARQLDYADRSGAKHAYDSALERWAIETVEQQRVVQSERLDDLWRRIYRAIAEGDLGQVDRALRIEKRRADLWGLDAPKQHEVAGVGGGALRPDVGDMLLARLVELRERQGPLVEDIDVDPLALTNGQGDVDPSHEVPVEPTDQS